MTWFRAKRAAFAEHARAGGRPGPNMHPRLVFHTSNLEICTPRTHTGVGPADAQADGGPARPRGRGVHRGLEPRRRQRRFRGQGQSAEALAPLITVLDAIRTLARPQAGASGPAPFSGGTSGVRRAARLRSWPARACFVSNDPPVNPAAGPLSAPGMSTVMLSAAVNYARIKLDWPQPCYYCGRWACRMQRWKHG